MILRNRRYHQNSIRALTVILYKKITSIWSQKEFDRKTSVLPKKMVELISRFKMPLDRQARALGKLLLLEAADELTYPLDLEVIKYNMYRKPYINSRFNFNISHSEEYVIVACTLAGEIGIDIEVMKDVALENYRPIFTDHEFDKYQKNENKKRCFYKTWTRKEALSKAVGLGLNLKFSSFDSSGHIISLNKKDWYLIELPIDSKVVCHLVTDYKLDLNKLLFRQVFCG